MGDTMNLQDNDEVVDMDEEIESKKDDDETEEDDEDDIVGGTDTDEVD
jgi:hypothetical protein